MMPTLNEFINGFGISEAALTALTLAIVLFCREGWRLKKLLRRKS